MDFDEIIDRRGTHSQKWDAMGRACGVTADDALPMWVADMDFRPPAPVTDALQRMIDVGVHGYFGDDSEWRAAVRWWMETRHGWAPDPAHLFAVNGLVNGTALCVDAFTAPGDAVVLMTPVYHAFFRVLEAAEREIRELPLRLDGDRYAMDFARWEGMMTGRERMLLLCSPHNPGGRVWSRAELAQVAEFARRHDLIVVSDEIHHDLVLPGHRHTPMALIDGVSDRLVTMMSATKSFNLAGAHLGCMSVEDPALRRRLAHRIKALGISPNAFGMHMSTAAYSPAGAAWIDALMAYLDDSRQLFDAAVAGIPGALSHRLEGTYLSWVDFAGTGLPPDEVLERVQGRARIAVNRGPTFGTGGESCLRFNIATPRSRVAEAADRLGEAFSDLC